MIPPGRALFLLERGGSGGIGIPERGSCPEVLIFGTVVGGSSGSLTSFVPTRSSFLDFEWDVEMA